MCVMTVLQKYKKFLSFYICRKDDDLAKLQVNDLKWKSDAEECKKQIDMYKQEAEEYKRKLENLDKIAQRLEQENKSYQENKEQ